MKRFLSAIFAFSLLALPLSAQNKKYTHAQLDSIAANFFTDSERNDAATADDNHELNDIEKDVFYYLNLARTNPPAFAKSYVKYYDGVDDVMKGYAFDSRKQSLISELAALKPLDILYPSSAIYTEAECYALQAGKIGIFGHERKGTSCGSAFSECCAYAHDNGLFVVLDLLIDWGENNADLGHRKICLAQYGIMGVAHQPHKVARNITVLNFGYNPKQIYTIDRYKGHVNIYGQMDGQGTLDQEDGGQYVGEWKNGVIEGSGIFTLPSGARYEGEWKDSKKQGYGIFHYANKDRYEGEWHNDTMHGKGTYFFSNNDRYEGEWIEGMKQEGGTYRLADEQ